MEALAVRRPRIRVDFVLTMNKSIVSKFHDDERGQMAFTFLLSAIVFFIIFALAIDAGVWYFDHRGAQNQAEAAATAAAQALPASTTATARAAADSWLGYNHAGSSNCPRIDGSGRTWLLDSGVAFRDRDGDGRYDTVRVCVRRNSLLLFSKLSNVPLIKVSAAAVATAGPAAGTNVMPWAFAVFDRTCDQIGKMCDVDLNANGVLNPGEADSCTFANCPFGLDPNRLAAFKNASGAGFTIRACGSGASDYRDCITGDKSSSGFTIGSTVTVDVQPGVQSGSSSTALDAWATANGDAGHACNISSTPDPANGGLDTDVVTGALATRLNTPACDYRKVVIPLMCYTAASNCVPPNGSQTLTVLGLAVYYVAGWDSKSAAGTKTIPCTQYNGGSPPAGQFDCGAVWGYLLFGVDPAARFQLNKLCDPATQNCSNPLAPILIVLTE